MLIEFTLENFRSFRDRARLSLVASSLTSRSPDLEAAVFTAKPGLELLTSAAIYGANASGKSNLVNALAFMRWFVMNSVRALEADAPIPIDVFRLPPTPATTTATLLFFLFL
jgi:AAA15 family ATPase/GTPase